MRGFRVRSMEDNRREQNLGSGRGLHEQLGPSTQSIHYRLSAMSGDHQDDADRLVLADGRRDKACFKSLFSEGRIRPARTSGDHNLLGL
jgi:hypothetical protein